MNDSIATVINGVCQRCGFKWNRHTNREKEYCENIWTGAWKWNVKHRR